MDDELQTFRPLHPIPAHPFIARAQVPARPGPEQQGHPPIRFIADHLINRAPFGFAVAQVVLLLQEAFETPQRCLFGDDVSVESLGRTHPNNLRKLFHARLNCVHQQPLSSKNLTPTKFSYLPVANKKPCLGDVLSRELLHSNGEIRQSHPQT